MPHRIEQGGARRKLLFWLGCSSVAIAVGLAACVGAEPLIPAASTAGADASADDAESASQSDTGAGSNGDATRSMSDGAVAVTNGPDAAMATHPTHDAAPVVCSGAPCNVTGLVAWYRADVGVTTNSQGIVTVWSDQSGNGNDAFETVGPTGADRGPSYEQAGVDGLPLPALYFTKTPGGATSPNVLSTAPFATALAQPFTELGVAFPTSAAQNDRFSLSGGLTDTSRAELGYNYGTRNPQAVVLPSLFVYAGNEVDSFDVPIGMLLSVIPQVGLWTGVFDEAYSQVYLNGVLRASGNAGANRLDGLSVGNLPGYVGEFLLYRGALSDSDRATIESYLGSRWMPADGGADGGGDAEAGPTDAGGP